MKILDLKKKDDEKAKPSKQILITGAVIIAAMIITIIIIYFLILPGYKKKIVDDVLYGDISDDVVTETTTEVDNAYAAAELKDEISKYVANYFTTTNIEEYLSDENVEQLADLIIKSLKDAGLLEQKDNSDEIRQSIMDQLKELLEQNNLTNEEKYELLKERFEKELKELQEKYSLTYLFISHDLSVVEYISDTVGVMYLGNLVEYGTTEDIFRNPLHPYTEALFSAIPIPDPEAKMNRIVLEGSIPSPANPPEGCKFHTRCAHCMERCKHEAPVQKEVEPGHYVVCHLYDK